MPETETQHTHVYVYVTLLRNVTVEFDCETLPADITAAMLKEQVRREYPDADFSIVDSEAKVI